MLERIWKNEPRRFPTISRGSLKVIFVIISNSSANRLLSFQRKLRPLNSIHRVAQFTLAATVATLPGARPEYEFTAEQLRRERTPVQFLRDDAIHSAN